MRLVAAERALRGAGRDERHRDLIVAGGVQNMSAIPISSAMTLAEPLGFSDPFSGSEGWTDRYGDQEVSQFRGAEMIADKWDISREDMERFALQSHERALAAIDEGRFADEIVPLGEVTTTRARAADTTLEKMANLPPLEEGGQADCGRGQPDLRRRVGDAHGERAGGEDPRAEAARSHPPHLACGPTIRSTC